MRRRFLLGGLVIGLIAATATAGPAAPAAGEPKLREQRIVAFGDSHGSYEQVVAGLRGVGLLDEELHWSGGADRLVMNGDLLDRGDQERPLLDLLMRLEVEAAAAGGALHVVLGNHEVMNLVHDLRYVAADGWRAFASFETPREREQAFEDWRSQLPDGDGESIEQLRELFDERIPRGYLGRRKALAADGYYGAWLLKWPFAVVLDGNLFIHAGVTEEIARLGVAGLNEEAGSELREYIETAALLRRRGVLRPLDGFRGDLQRAHAFISPSLPAPGSRSSPALRSAAVRLVELSEGLPFSRTGPVWYRGTSLENEVLERERLETSLELLGVQRVIVGHTPTASARITSRFEGRVIRLDVGMVYRHASQALVIEADRLRAYDTARGEYLPLPAEPVQGEGTSETMAELTRQEIERVLSEGQVVSLKALGRGSTRPGIARLELEGNRLRAIFKVADDMALPEEERRRLAAPPQRYQNEVLAYRLDRWLELGLVPPTTLRRIGSREGSLQVWIERAVDQRAMKAYGLVPKDEKVWRSHLCRARWFDALVGIDHRDPADRLCIPADSRLLLVDNGAAFTEQREFAGPIFAEGCYLAPGERARLQQLNRRTLRKIGGSLLSARRRSALLARRDAILDLDREAKRKTAESEATPAESVR